MKFNTKVIHAGIDYARSQNPTRSVLEKSLAALENGYDAICFGSGLAAMDACLRLLKSGDQVIATNDLYGGSYRLMNQVFADYGIDFKFVNLEDASSIKDHISEATKMIWIETPTNPMLNIIDISAVCIERDQNATPESTASLRKCQKNCRLLIDQ